MLSTECMFLIVDNVSAASCHLLPPSKLDNSRSVTSGENGPHVHVEFCQYAGHMSSYVDYRVCPAVASSEEQPDICQRFSVSFKPLLHPKQSVKVKISSRKYFFFISKHLHYIYAFSRHFYPK